MLPAWWESGPKQSAEGAIRRYKGADVSVDEHQKLLEIVRQCVQSLAVAARVESALVTQMNDLLPLEGGVRDELIRSYLNKSEDERRTIANTVTQYDIDLEALSQHFARR